MNNQYKLDIIPNFNVTILYVVNKHADKLIPTITNVTHNDIEIIEIIDRDILLNVRSMIFKEINSVI